MAVMGGNMTRLYRPKRYFRRGYDVLGGGVRGTGGAPAFDPLSLFLPGDLGANTLLIADAAYITEVGGRVSAWENLVGGGPTFEQPMATNQPNWLTPGADGLPAVGFGATHELASPGFPYRHMFLVGRATALLNTTRRYMRDLIRVTTTSALQSTGTGAVIRWKNTAYTGAPWAMLGDGLGVMDHEVTATVSPTGLGLPNLTQPMEIVAFAAFDDPLSSAAREDMYAWADANFGTVTPV